MITDATPLVLVGAGKMGTALLDAWLDRGMAADRVRIIDPGLADGMARGYRKRGAGVFAQADGDALDGARVVVLAVKPQTMGEVLSAIAGRVPAEAVVVSVAAGTIMATLEAAFAPGQAIVRVMPNTPALAGAGMSVVCANDHTGADELAIIDDLMGAVGEVATIAEETLMDAVTAVSGSGPAYVFWLAECLAASAVEAGLPSDLAEVLARQTVVGGGALLGQSDLPAATLRANVTSPGGTTAAALEVLMDSRDGLAPLLTRAVLAAKARSVMLS